MGLFLQCSIDFMMALQSNDLSSVPGSSRQGITLGKSLNTYRSEIITMWLYWVVRIKWGNTCKSLVRVSTWYIAVLILMLARTDRSRDDTTVTVFHKWSGNLQHKYFAHNTRANLFLLTELNFKIMLWPKINKEKLI